MFKNNLNIFNHVSDIVGIKQQTIMQYRNKEELGEDRDRFVEQIESIIKRIADLDVDK